MKLPFLPSFKKKVTTSYFLVLILRQDNVNAVIFEEVEGKVKIIGQRQEYFSQSIEDIDSDEFIEVLDKAISQAEASLPNNIQTQKTIFGVKEEWSQNNQIKKEYLIKLKRASEELELTPIGFLVISQAISHLLQKEEGAPVSAILAEINKKSVTVTLIKGGKIVEAKTSDIHNSVPFTVDALLKYFHASEVLPSRIIIFNGKGDLSQEFISHTWSKSLPFLHLPQITNLPVGFDAKSVLSGVATQMGFEVLEGNMSHEKQTESAEEKTIEENRGNQQEGPTNHEGMSTDDFGFIKDKDVAKMPIQEEQEDKVPKVSGTIQDNSTTETTPIKKGRILTTIKSILVHVVRITMKIDIRKPFSYFPKGRMAILIPVVLLLITTILSYFLFVHATITITITPKIAQHDQKITFSTTSQSQPNKNIIKGEFVTVSEDGTVSTPATGKKDVGTKAKGTVTVFNSLSENKTLPQGSVIKSPNSLEFTLDESLVIKGVASHSADETVSPEKATVNVIASDLGKEYNLPSGTKFNVSIFDITDLVAKNDDPFSGGTKKEITVVSAKDSDKLESNLPRQLEKKAMEHLSKKLNKDRLLLPVFISNTLTKKTMDAKAGDEKDNLTLTGSVEYKGLSYNKTDLIIVGRPLLEKGLSKDEKIDYNNIKAGVKDIKPKNSEEIDATITIKALLLLKLDESKLKKEIKGISFTNVEDLIYELPQVSNVDIILTPKLPFLPRKFPIFERNIKIIMQIEDG